MSDVKKTMSNSISHNHARDLKTAALIYIHQYAENSAAEREGRRPFRHFSNEIFFTAQGTLFNSTRKDGCELPVSMNLNNIVYDSDLVYPVRFYDDFAFINVPDKDIASNNKRYVFLAATSDGILFDSEDLITKNKVVPVSIPADITLGNGNFKIVVAHSNFGDFPLAFCKHLKNLYGISITTDPNLLTVPETEHEYAAYALVKGILAGDEKQILNADIVRGLYNLSKVEKSVEKALEHHRVTLAEKGDRIIMVVVRQETTSIY